MRIYLKKIGGMLCGDTEADKEALRKFKQGKPIKAEITSPRNYEYHKKFFAMVGVGFDAFDPGELKHNGIAVSKDFDRFRKDCIIQAGFYDVVANLKSEVRAEAHSISFANMEQADFEKVYSQVANVILQRVLTNYSRDDLDRVVSEILGFV